MVRIKNIDKQKDERLRQVYLIRISKDFFYKMFCDIQSEF